MSGWPWKSNRSPARGLSDVAVPASSYLGMAGAYGSSVPEPLPGDHPAPHRDNRPTRFPEIPGGERGRPRPPHITPPPEPRIPDVPTGTLVHLLPGEWMYQARRDPADQIVMRIVEVLPDRPRPNGSVVWVTGHGVECAWPSSTCRKRPCYELLVSVEALWRAVDR